MNSMTGYGRGEASNNSITVLVEIKSVNNRFRDINVRLPRDYLILEPRVQREIKRFIQRGRLDVFVRRTAAEGSQRVVADPALAERYLQEIRAVAARLQIPASAVTLEPILAQPGVLTVAEDSIDALGEWILLSTALGAALDDLRRMRAAEGRAMEDALRRDVDQVQRLWAEVQAASEGVAERLAAKLQTRVLRLVGEHVDPSRITTEAAILADKADISEELARISSHCRQFLDALGSDEPVGRRLEFLVQELNREVNTVGSKAVDHPISARVVSLKSVLERLREQAANVE